MVPAYGNFFQNDLISKKKILYRFLAHLAGVKEGPDGDSSSVDDGFNFLGSGGWSPWPSSGSSPSSLPLDFIEVGSEAVDGGGGGGGGC